MTIQETVPLPLRATSRPPPSSSTREVFGATEEMFRLTEPGGRIGHAELDFGGSIRDAVATNSRNTASAAPPPWAPPPSRCTCTWTTPMRWSRARCGPARRSIMRAGGSFLRRTLGHRPRPVRPPLECRARHRGRGARGNAAALHRRTQVRPRGPPPGLDRPLLQQFPGAQRVVGLEGLVDPGVGVQELDRVVGREGRQALGPEHRAAQLGDRLVLAACSSSTTACSVWPESARSSTSSTRPAISPLGVVM